MSHQQLITIVTLQLIAVLSVGWYLVLERTHSSDQADTPPSSMIPAAPTMAPPLDWEPEYVDGYDDTVYMDREDGQALDGMASATSSERIAVPQTKPQ